MTLRAPCKNHSTTERLIGSKKEVHGNMSLGAHCKNHSLERLIRSKKGVNGMRIKPNRQQAIVCQTCGATGYSELLLFCINCQISAVHRYCLYEIPENNEVEVSWVCEQCMQRACSLCSCQCADSKASGISAFASHPLKNGSEYGGRGLPRGISYSTEIVNSSPVIETNEGGKKTKMCLEILLSCDHKDAESLRTGCIREGENPFNSIQVGEKKDGSDHDIGRKCPFGVSSERESSL